MRTVVLHLGAHKTATTFTQLQLEKHQPLFRHDQKFFPLKVLRKNVTPFVKAKKRSAKKVEAFFEDYTDTDRIIISDENFLGDARQLKKGALFSDMEERCCLLKESLSKNSVFEVYFSFRDYRDFVASMYCEYLRHNDFCTFEQYIEFSNYEAISWNSVHQRLCSVFGKASVTMVEYTNFSSHEKIIMQHLLPDGVDYQRADIANRPGLTRATLTVSCIELLEKSTEFLDGPGTRKVFRSLEKRNLDPHWRDSSKFRPLESRLDLLKKYQEDCKTINLNQ